MVNNKVKYLTQAAVIGALYVALTLLFAPISYGEVQVRISEALTVLPFFTPAAIPGLFVGCILANLIGGSILVDVIFGSLATLLGAIGTYAIRKYRVLVPVPPIVSNTIIIPLVLRFGYGVNLPVYLLGISIFAGEVVSCYVLGMILLLALNKYRGFLFSTHDMPSD